jgi:hypothetical protein
VSGTKANLLLECRHGKALDNDVAELVVRLTLTLRESPRLDFERFERTQAFIGALHFVKPGSHSEIAGM